MMNWNGPHFNGDRTKFKFPDLENLKRQLRVTNTFNIANNAEENQARIFHNHQVGFQMHMNSELWIKLMIGKRGIS